MTMFDTRRKARHNLGVVLQWLLTAQEGKDLPYMNLVTRSVLTTSIGTKEAHASSRLIQVKTTQAQTGGSAWSVKTEYKYNASARKLNRRYSDRMQAV
jgi:hypothetical protein